MPQRLLEDFVACLLHPRSTTGPCSLFTCRVKLWRSWICQAETSFPLWLHQWAPQQFTETPGGRHLLKFSGMEKEVKWYSGWWNIFSLSPFHFMFHSYAPFYNPCVLCTTQTSRIPCFPSTLTELHECRPSHFFLGLVARSFPYVPMS